MVSELSAPGAKVTLTIDTIPSVTQLQSFTNERLHQTIMINPTQIAEDFMRPSENLTAAGWQTGDPILYDSNGGANIPDLVSGTTYYAIVYRPGFAENGLVQDNKVDNCSVSGYQDDRCPTDSGWFNNTAFLNGTPASHCANYEINWPCKKPLVDRGSLGETSEHQNKYNNFSVIKTPPCKKKERETKHTR